MDIKRIYCDNCHQYTDYVKIGRKSLGENYGHAGRVMLGIMTLGITELCTDKYYYQCAKCGNIKKRI